MMNEEKETMGATESVKDCQAEQAIRLTNFLRHLKCSGYGLISETCGLSIAELEAMAARQARQLETQDQLLAAKAQRLRFLKSGGEAEKLQRLREKVASQEERLRKLRALRGKVQSNRTVNSSLSSDLESLRAVFNEKEKELSLAVAKVDELTRQLEDLRRGNKDPANGQTTAAAELEKLRRELMYRQKLREAQATRVAAQRAALSQRQEESLRVDRRIAELQERLHRKRLLNHQLAATLKHQESVDDFVSGPNKNDPKYQTLPYNAKLFAFSANKDQQQENFEKAMQHQMQILQIDQSSHHQNKTPLSNNVQIHQILAQNHINAKSGLIHSNNIMSHGHHSNSQPNSPVSASTTTASIPNGLQMVHSTMANNNVSRGKAFPISTENNFPLVRPSNFVPTGGASSNSILLNLGYNGGNSQQVVGPKESSSSGSNASVSGSSVSDGFSTGIMSGMGAPGRPAKPALPPKPPKPTPPPRQAPDVFSFNQRSSSTSGGQSEGVMHDRTELPIKPKPLFLKKHMGGSHSSSANAQLSNSSEKESNISSTTVRVSINRRIEMPPAFLFPESDPPPSDLIPEHQSSSSFKQGDVVEQDSVDSSAYPKNNHLLPEEYTLPDLFPSPRLDFLESMKANEQSMKEHLSNENIINNNESMTGNRVNSLTTNLNLFRGNNVNLGPISGNFPDPSELSHPSDENRKDRDHHHEMRESETKGHEENHISVMEIQVGTEGLKENQNQIETKIDSANQLESLEAGGEVQKGSENEKDSNFSESSNSTPTGIVRRIKKGNLKSGNKDHASVGRRVSFDPLALLLDASLEGELDLVMKTAGEVGNASSANDEGITALHNAICAGHADVVRFLVEFGCDVNAQDSDGWTPLHCAASCNNVGMVKFLVERGACIFATTLSDHETAAEKCEEDEDGFGPCSEYLYSIQEKLGIMNGGAVYAVFDYEAQNPDELTFRDGEKLVILRKGDELEREWWWAAAGDKQGYAPRNLLGLYTRVVHKLKDSSS